VVDGESLAVLGWRLGALMEGVVVAVVLATRLVSG
jgi:hypothetical protein